MLYKAKRKIEKAKTQVRAKVEHPFRVIKRQFGYVKTRLRGLVKQLRFGWYHTELCNAMLRIMYIMLNLVYVSPTSLQPVHFY